MKVKLTDGTNYQMSVFGKENNKEYLVQVIAVKRLLEQKQTIQDIRKAVQVVVEVRKEIELLLKAQEGETEFKKDEHMKKLSKIKKQHMTSCKLAVTEALKAYTLFPSFNVGKVQTQWDKILHEMHSKDP